jgi:hypothetical protein
LSGSASVNGSNAKVGTIVRAGDRVATGKDSTAVVIVGRDAYLLRDNTTLTFEESKEKAGVVAQVLISAGRALAVFQKRGSDQIKVRTKSATIGIRGTGMYLEEHATRTYFCLCYGEAAIDGVGMKEPKIVRTTHHEQPLWLDDSGGTMKAEKGPFMNHSDDELILLEKVVGREPPFLKMQNRARY